MTGVLHWDWLSSWQLLIQEKQRDWGKRVKGGGRGPVSRSSNHVVSVAAAAFLKPLPFPPTTTYPNTSAMRIRQTVPIFPVLSMLQILSILSILPLKEWYCHYCLLQKNYLSPPPNFYETQHLQDENVLKSRLMFSAKLSLLQTSKGIFAIHLQVFVVFHKAGFHIFIYMNSYIKTCC